MGGLINGDFNHFVQNTEKKNTHQKTHKKKVCTFLMGQKRCKKVKLTTSWKKKQSWGAENQQAIHAFQAILDAKG